MSAEEQNKYLQDKKRSRSEREKGKEMKALLNPLKDAQDTIKEDLSMEKNL